MSAVASFKKLWAEQPLLAGCGCVLALSLVLCGVGGLLIGLGWQVAGGKLSELSGVDSILATSQSLAEHGLTFSVSNTTEKGTEYTLLPIEPREITCEELKAALGPHLVGDKAKIVILSESTAPAIAGSAPKSLPIRCAWDAGAAGVPDAVDRELPRASP